MIKTVLTFTYLEQNFFEQVKQAQFSLASVHLSQGPVEAIV